MKQIAEARPAATIMLARDNNGQLEVLLVKRNSRLAFAGGAWVFPGGKIEQSEFEQASDTLGAARLAAVRETMEETQLNVNNQELIFFRHWTTPVIEPRRFATWFFFASANEASNEVIIDDSEIKKYQWICPQEALDLLKMNKIFLMPPTFLSMLLIRHCNNVDAARSVLQKETVVHVKPVMCQNRGRVDLLYEGDMGYQAADPHRQGPRHRMVLIPQEGKMFFEYRDCKHVPPVTGGDQFFNLD